MKRPIDAECLIMNKMTAGHKRKLVTDNTHQVTAGKWSIELRHLLRCDVLANAPPPLPTPKAMSNGGVGHRCCEKHIPLATC